MTVNATPSSDFYPHILQIDFLIRLVTDVIYASTNQLSNPK